MSVQQRYLAAIMFSDIVGYSSLMGMDEDKAFNILRKNRLIHKTCIEKHGGQWLKEMGDGILAKFSSAYDSVQCALEIQKKAHNELEGSIRIGIHLGDVIFENKDAFGDGVNIAARLQSIADPGGIYISESIRKAIRGKKEVQSLYMGEVELKNISLPVKIYSIQGEGLPIPAKRKLRKLLHRGSRKKRIFNSAKIFVIFFIVMVAMGWWVWNSFIINKNDGIKSLAVLPFENYSGDQDQEFLESGIQDNLITTLSQLGSLRVISKTSTLKYKNTNKSISEIAHELDVDAIIEASVMKFGDSIRINVQLIQAFPEEQHLWAQIYDRPLSNIFFLLNDVTQSISEEINLRLTSREKALLSSAKQVDPEAYQAYLRGRVYWDKLTPQDLQTALEYYQMAIEKDPAFAPAYAGIAAVWAGRRQIGIVPHLKAYHEAKKAIEKAFLLDSANVEVLYNYAISMGWMAWDWEKTDKIYQKVLELNPSHANAHAYYSNFLMVMNKVDEAEVHMKKALELDPYNSVIQGLHVVNLAALKRCHEVFKLEHEGRLTHQLARNGLWLCYILEGNYDKAYEEEMARIVRRHDNELKETMEIGYKNGGYFEANKMKAELLEKRIQHTYVPVFTIVQAYAVEGQKEKTLEWLEKALAEHDPNLPYISIIPLFDFLRKEPRFKSILRAMNLPEI